MMLRIVHDALHCPESLRLRDDRNNGARRQTDPGLPATHLDFSSNRKKLELAEERRWSALLR